jgi:hypothetical protein
LLKITKPENVMKKLARPLFFVGALCTLLVQSGCYGSFSLTNKIYDWNDSAIDNKFGKSLLFWVLCIIPVYGFCALADIVILNLIEFWTGSNPISMKEGDYEQQLVERNGVHYKMEATRNKLAITPLDGPKAGKTTAFIYRASDKTWNIETDGKLVTIAKVDFGADGNNSVTYLLPAGKSTTMALPSNEQELAGMMHARKMNVAVK